MEKRFVRPGVGADGAPIATRNPATMKPLSPDGEWVAYDSTARRRLRDGDWQEVPAPAAAAEIESEVLNEQESDKP